MNFDFDFIDADDDEIKRLEKKRRKQDRHNVTERNRVIRLNEAYEELRNLVGKKEDTKLQILLKAIDLVKSHPLTQTIDSENQSVVVEELPIATAQLSNDTEFEKILEKD
jgi:hypothetical protein